MRLRDYLTNTREKNETVYDRFARFGRSIGVSMDCVRKWVYGSRGINDRMKRKIVEVTDGRVRVVDLMQE